MENEVEVTYTAEDARKDAEKYDGVEENFKGILEQIEDRARKGFRQTYYPTGVDTQKLANRLEELGYEVELISHPSEIGRVREIKVSW